jgi:hypothetical protein
VALLRPTQDGSIEWPHVVKAMMNGWGGELINFAKTKGAATWI